MPGHDRERTNRHQTTDPDASADWRTEYAANEAALPDDPPTADEVAARLGVDPRRLIQFVDYHPDPSAAHVLGWATGDPQHREIVAAWLAARDRRQRQKAVELDAGALPTDTRGVWRES